MDGHPPADANRMDIDPSKDSGLDMTTPLTATTPQTSPAPKAAGVAEPMDADTEIARRRAEYADKAAAKLESEFDETYPPPNPAEEASRAYESINMPEQAPEDAQPATHGTLKKGAGKTNRDLRRRRQRAGRHPGLKPIPMIKAPGFTTACKLFDGHPMVENAFSDKRAHVQNGRRLRGTLPHMKYARGETPASFKYRNKSKGIPKTSYNDVDIYDPAEEMDVTADPIATIKRFTISDDAQEHRDDNVLRYNQEETAYDEASAPKPQRLPAARSVNDAAREEELKQFVRTCDCQSVFIGACERNPETCTNFKSREPMPEVRPRPHSAAARKWWNRQLMLSTKNFKENLMASRKGKKSSQAAMNAKVRKMLNARQAIKARMVMEGRSRRQFGRTFCILGAPNPRRVSGALAFEKPQLNIYQDQDNEGSLGETANYTSAAHHQSANGQQGAQAVPRRFTQSAEAFDRTVRKLEDELFQSVPGQSGDLSGRRHVRPSPTPI